MMMNDLISRQAAIDAVNELTKWYMEKYHETRPTTVAVIDRLMDLPSAQQWIPLETRPLTEDEKAEHPEWKFFIEGEIPEEGQRILVNVTYKWHDAVQIDEWKNDGEGFYLDSGYDIGTEVTAWMPLPERFRGDGNGE
jgi:hypothetical protein